MSYETRQSIIRNVDISRTETGDWCFFCRRPRIDQESRERCKNIVKMVADTLAENVSTAEIVYSPILVDSERQADLVAQHLKRPESVVWSALLTPGHFHN